MIVSTDPSPFSYAHRLESKSSVWRKGSTAHQASRKDTHDFSDSTTSSPLSAKSLAERRSSCGSPSTAIKFSRISPKNHFSSSDDSSNVKLDLKEQINENLLLTQEIMDLKMCLATALAQVDAEKHTNRLQSEQIANLCDDNEYLKNELDEANLQIIDMTQTKGVLTAPPSTPADDKQEGWLRRVSSGLARSTSSSTLLSARRSSTCSTSSQLKKSMSRLTSFTDDLANEEVPDSKKRTSFLSSLSSFAEGSHRPPNSMSDQKNDDWLDLDTVVLDTDRHEKNDIFTCTARRACL